MKYIRSKKATHPISEKMISDAHQNIICMPRKSKFSSMSDEEIKRTKLEKLLKGPQ